MLTSSAISSTSRRTAEVGSKEKEMTKKLNRYSVLYKLTTSSEAIIKAKTKKEAIAKVREVIGDPITIEDAWELKRK